jgi:hypothetical protein
MRSAAVAPPTGTDVVRRSALVETARGLLASSTETHPAVIGRSFSGGQPMTHESLASYGNPSIARYFDGSAAGASSSAGLLGDTAAGDVSVDLDDLADRVVERIEQRVIDELERRGRRHSSGAF